MSQSSHLPIYNSAFFLLKEYYKRVPKFPKQYKYFLGERMIESLVDIIKLVQEANNQKNNYKRVLVIDKIGKKVNALPKKRPIKKELTEEEKKAVADAEAKAKADKVAAEAPKVEEAPAPVEAETPKTE